MIISKREIGQWYIRNNASAMICSIYSNIDIHIKCAIAFSRISMLFSFVLILAIFSCMSFYAFCVISNSTFNISWHSQWRQKQNQKQWATNLNTQMGPKCVSCIDAYLEFSTCRQWNIYTEGVHTFRWSKLWHSARVWVVLYIILYAVLMYSL